MLTSNVDRGGLLHADLDTLVTALYVEIDDHVVGPRRGRGRRPRLSDAELVCLAAAQMLVGARSERHWLRRVARELGHLFPYVPQQPGYHRRLKAAAPLLRRTVEHLARACPSWCDQLRLLDATPVPCAASVATVRRSDLAGWANYGYCPAHSRFYWGLKLYLLATPDGMPTAWCLAEPKLGERDVAAALLERAPLRTRMTILADKGFAGHAFEQAVSGLGMTLVRPDRADETPRHGNLGGIRQWIESVYDTLKDQLHLERHGGRTPLGVATRITQRLLALAAAIWHNWTTGQPNKRSLITYDH